MKVDQLYLEWKFTDFFIL